MDTYLYYSDPMVTTTASTNQAMGIWAVVASVLALVGGILVYFLFVKSKQEPKGKFVKWLKDFLAFKTMWLEPLVKILYYVATIEVILMSFAIIPQNFLAFLVMLILGPIVVRLVYELFMMLIMMWRNSQEIADNTKKK